MRCENCQAELAANSTKCPECGELVLQNVEGFHSTKDVERKLKAIVDQHGKEIIYNNTKFIALLNDYLPEYEKERGLLKNMLDAGVPQEMLKEPNQNMAIMNAKGTMLGKFFLSENASEFVIVCFSYMFGWEYASSLREKEPEEKAVENEPKKRKLTAMDVEMNPFDPVAATRYRLSGNVKIAEGYTKIESFCFDRFGFMKTISLPSSILAIGEYAFSECKHLKSINLPENLKIIKSGAFSQCVKLTVINIPKGIIAIEDNTFQFCENLEVVEIPDTVGSIGSKAFAGCVKLRKLFLPDSIKFIESDAFLYCPELSIICYENSYVHKYCLANGIDVETVSEGKSLRAKIRKEG